MNVIKTTVNCQCQCPSREASCVQRSAIPQRDDECTQWRRKKKQKPKAFAHIFRFTRKVFSHQKTRKSAAGKCAFLNLASPLRSHAPESERQKTRKALPPPKSRRNRFRCAIQRTGENYRLRLCRRIDKAKSLRPELNRWKRPHNATDSHSSSPSDEFTVLFRLFSNNFLSFLFFGEFYFPFFSARKAGERERKQGKNCKQESALL